MRDRDVGASRLLFATVRGVLLILAASAAGLAALAPPQWITQWFSRGWFPIWQRLVVPWTGAVSCSWSLLALVVLVGALGLLAILTVRQGRVDGWGPACWCLTKRLGWGFLTLWVWFAWGWGLGYRQVPVEERSGLVRSEQLGSLRVESADLERLIDHLIEVVRRDLPVRIAAQGTDDDLAEGAELHAMRSSARAVRAVTLEWEGWEPAMPRFVKHSPKGLLLAFGTSGVCSPWLLEAHTAGGLTSVGRIEVGVHELAHVVGYNGEADAELVKLVAGLRADDGLVRYAVALFSLRRVAAALGFGVHWQRICRRLPRRALVDLGAERQAVAKRRIEALAKPSWAVYDKYLRVQGVEAGAADYGRAVGLWVAAIRMGQIRK